MAHQLATTEHGDSPTLSTLPPELRNTIYRYVLLSDEAVEVTAAPSKPTSDNILSRSTLLRACQQFRREATTIFYTENAFRLVCTDTAHNRLLMLWLNSVSEKHAPSIEKLTIAFNINEQLQSLVTSMSEEDDAPALTERRRRYGRLMSAHFHASVDFAKALSCSDIPHRTRSIVVEKPRTPDTQYQYIGSPENYKKPVLDRMKWAFMLYIPDTITYSKSGG